MALKKGSLCISAFGGHGIEVTCNFGLLKYEKTATKELRLVFPAEMRRVSQKIRRVLVEMDFDFQKLFAQTKQENFTLTVSAPNLRDLRDLRDLREIISVCFSPADLAKLADLAQIVLMLNQYKCLIQIFERNFKMT